MLAVTGRRLDGFHDLVSVVATLEFGDTIRLQRMHTGGAVRLTCDHPTLSIGSDNLAFRAAEAFRAATGFAGGVAIELTKRIPLGAGLGGGSSNAATVLSGLNTLAGDPLPPEELERIAATLGSDCPLFLAGEPCVIRGRGERIARLPRDVLPRIGGARVLLFKPNFGVATSWAYGQLAAAQTACLEAKVAEARLAAWCGSGGAPLAALLFNSFEGVVLRKFIALAVLAEMLRGQPGVDGVLLSGSGSASFALLSPAADAVQLAALVRECLGEEAFVKQTFIPS